MLFDGIKLVEGSEIRNLVVDSGATFPTNPDQGELFYHVGDITYDEGLYVRNGTMWKRMLSDSDAIEDILPDIVTAGTYKSVTVDSTGRVTAGTNPTTLAGYGITDAQPLDDDLTSIAALAGTSGFLKKIAENTWQLDTATYLTANQTITLTGDVTGSGSTSIATVLGASGVAPGTYGGSTSVAQVAVDNKGRVTSASNVSIAIDASAVTSGTFTAARISEASVTQHQAALTILESQITDGSILARVASSENISGSWSFINPVTVGSPSTASHAATKQYVDTVAQGLSTKPAVEIVATSNLTATYNNGSSGVGATLTATSNVAFPTIDGVTLTSTTLGLNGVLVAAQSNPAHNGRYNLTQVGDGSSPWILTRCALCDEASEIPGAYVFVKQGSTYAASGWVQTVANPSTFTVGTDAISVTQFSGAGSYSAGNGLTLSGNEFNVGTVSSARIVVNADNIDLATTAVSAGSYGSASSVGTFTVDSYGRLTAAASTSIAISATQVTSGQLSIANGGTGSSTAEGAANSLGVPKIAPATPKNGDIQVSGSVVSIYAGGAWRQVFPAVYS